MDKKNETPPEAPCAQPPPCPWMRAILLMTVSAALGGGGVYYALQEWAPHRERGNNASERLEDQISKLNQQIKTIEPLAVRIMELESQIQVLIQQGETLKHSVQQTSVEPQLQEMITQLKGRLEDMASQTLALRHSHQLGQILSRLQESLDKGRHFGVQLDLLSKAARGNAELTSLGQMLASYRDQPPPTAEALKAEFKALSGQLIQATSQGDLWHRTKAYLQNLIVIESKDFDALAVPTIAQVITQIQRHLSQGEVAAAVHAFDHLSEDVRAHGTDWYAEAQAYLALQTALDAAISEVHS